MSLRPTSVLLDPTMMRSTHLVAQQRAARMRLLFKSAHSARVRATARALLSPSAAHPPPQRDDGGDAVMTDANSPTPVGELSAAEEGAGRDWSPLRENRPTLRVRQHDCVLQRVGH